MRIKHMSISLQISRCYNSLWGLMVFEARCGIVVKQMTLKPCWIEICFKYLMQKSICSLMSGILGILVSELFSMEFLGFALCIWTKNIVVGTWMAHLLMCPKWSQAKSRQVVVGRGVGYWKIKVLKLIQILYKWLTGSLNSRWNSHTVPTYSMWWFQKIFGFHPEKLGKMNPFWRAYFSKGLKPPTGIGL